MKFLVDECLSPQLTKHAIEAGYAESSHVTWLGAAGWPDWKLMPLILDGDWTFVTKNSVDFRGPASAPGAKGQYRLASLHAGLICLNGPPAMNLSMQLTGFKLALNALEGAPDLTNMGLEVTLGLDDEDAEIIRYDLPPE
ncbi:MULTISPECIES: DUF5615 family PIN-like protein [unclassified Caulobacter]|uniref:DUF5615 family PIN-like protein n=1 Tax=unclassified Caulobacter TaxID=2648921 RepID=UPI000780B4C2|nr:MULTISPECIES: DUF5615 family PIN-like protein [unclassified Caulobacter]AZS19914.1 hypothetical protein CSW63_04195 [Caulobacter sp. FWC26]